MSSPMAGVTLVNAIVFGVYAQVQKYTVNPSNLSTHFLAGAIAGLAQSPIASPLELAKTRMQLQSSTCKNNKNYTGAIHCLRDIYKHAGITGIFNGLGITALRETPSFGIYFLTYETLTRNNNNSTVPITTIHMLIAGGLAGTASWIVTYPIDVIKSRLQADINSKYSGAIDCFKKSITQEGFICLFRGLNSTILRAFPTNAATFAIVNWTFRLLGNNNNNNSIEKIDVDNNKQQINHVYHQNTWKNRVDTCLDRITGSILESTYAKSLCLAVASSGSRDSSSVTADDSSTTSSGSIVETDTVT